MNRLSSTTTALASLIVCSACVSSVQSVLLSYQGCRAIEIATCKPVYGLIGHGPTFGYVYNDCQPTGFLLFGTGPVFSGPQIRLYTPGSAYSRESHSPASSPSELEGSITLNSARGFATLSLSHAGGRPFKYNGRRYFMESHFSAAEAPCNLPPAQQR